MRLSSRVKRKGVGENRKPRSVKFQINPINEQKPVRREPPIAPPRIINLPETKNPVDVNNQEVPGFVIILIIFATIATLCSVLSTGGIHWIHHKVKNQNDGLWISCTNGLCYRMSNQPSWLVLAQYLFICSCLLSIVGVILIIASISFEEPKYVFATVVFVLSLVCLSIAIGVYTYNASLLKVSFGWSYMFACLNLFCWLCCTAAIVQKKCC